MAVVAGLTESVQKGRGLSVCAGNFNSRRLEHTDLATPVQNRQISPGPPGHADLPKKNKAKTKSKNKAVASHQSAGLYPTGSSPLANDDLRGCK
jgi:hypothetical protein